ncbi:MULTISPECIES: (2Fe-2S) ferredoxin domain-containing protein [unclassified Streptomyces]|uniref:(2Fe-2S) ferredoxin domain-containing protein n=1 Tax=unclassified Streptomyces TaxID=2593676 RepID=UPI0035DC0062
MPARTLPTGREPVPCRIVLCRDCCCGTPKVTGVDHAARTERLSARAPVRFSACPDLCEQADVIVVQPSAEGPAAGARPVSPRLVNDPDATENIAAWATAGGPGVLPQPDVPDLCTLTPPRRHTTPRP